MALSLAPFLKEWEIQIRKKEADLSKFSITK
jgi:hypothetical protein